MTLDNKKPPAVTVVTPCYNGARFLSRTVDSVLAQRREGVALEYIVMDGGSNDGSLDILRAYGDAIDQLASAPDQGPADAINRGFALAHGDILCWLGADDIYYPGALKRVVTAMAADNSPFCFGHCPMIDDQDRETRQGISRFKELFFPFSSRFVFQCINYVSQPALFFRRSAWDKAGPLRLGMAAAWDYDFFLRLWRLGDAALIPRPALAAFRVHGGSISATFFRDQFREEWQAAAVDAGRFSPQSAVHLAVRWGIVGAYSVMSRLRRADDRA